MKQWEVLAKLKTENSKFKTEELIKLLLKNRKIETKKDIEEFLSPDITNVTPQNLGIDEKELKKALARIKEAIAKKEQVIVYGDYDVDGITGAAILWESLKDLGVNVMPYIPHRVDEGYGLSEKGITNLKEKYKDTTLIITVDNGIVANKAVDFANKKKIDVIITDHHVPSKAKPKAYCVIHSTKVCGAAVGWVFSRYLEKNILGRTDYKRHLELVALASVADVMTLVGANRTLVRLGIDDLRKTQRVGLNSLFEAAGIDKKGVGVYEIGHLIAPRLNASGRIEHAIDSLRLICTPVKKRADELALHLNEINSNRQKFTSDSFEHAKAAIVKNPIKKLIYIYHESYQAGVIGLIAGKLVEEYYRPAIVLSKGDLYSKASARSISGVNIVEFIRTSMDLLVDVGGHPMAAGFTVETKNIDLLKEALEKLAEKEVTESFLIRKLKIDCELPISLISEKLFNEIVRLSPFGPGNPEPVFLAKKVLIESMSMVGKEKNHLKLVCFDGNHHMSGISFSFENLEGIGVGDKVDIAYTITQNVWNGSTKLELKVRELRRASS